jgi:hypothetical protein
MKFAFAICTIRQKPLNINFLLGYHHSEKLTLGYWYFIGIIAAEENSKWNWCWESMAGGRVAGQR